MDKEDVMKSSLMARLDALENVVIEAPASSVHIDEKGPAVILGNPSPLGLFGFAIVTAVSGVTKLSTDPSSRIDGLFAVVALFVGGAAQAIAGILQYFKGHTHSATIFSIFGAHWIGQGLLITLRIDGDFPDELRPASSATYHMVLAIVTFILFIPSLQMNRVLSFAVGAVVPVFVFEVVEDYGMRWGEIGAGVFACVASSLALYLAAVDLINEAWEAPVLPLFPHHSHKRDYERRRGSQRYVPRLTYHKSAMASAQI